MPAIAAIMPRPSTRFRVYTAGQKRRAVLAAAGYNFRRLIQWLRLLLLRILIAFGLLAQLRST
jgi:hypothetical protein